MSENALVPSINNRPRIPNNMLLLAIPLFLLLSRDRFSKDVSSASNNVTVNNILNNIVEPLDNIIKKLNIKEISRAMHPRNLEPGVEVLKRVGPYLPEEYIPTINKVVLSFEKINRVVSLIDFISTANSYEPIYSVEVNNNKERVMNILQVIKEELPNDKYSKIGPIIDIATNADKIKNLSNVASSLLNPSKGSSTVSTSSLEDIIELVVPLLGNKNINKNKIKEMINMVEMLRVLNEDDDDAE